MNGPHGTGTGNRAFWRLIVISASMRALLAYGICCLALATFTALRSAGPGSLWSSDPSLLPGMLVLGLAAIGLTRAAWSLGRSAWHSAAVARYIRRRRVAAPPRLATWRGNLGDRLVTLDAPAPYALTYGALRPRILVTTGLLRTLSDAELAAVLTHEREHLRSRDPLKNVLARAILARHFYLPALTGLRDRFTSGRELSADRAAMAAHGVPALAGALLKVTEGPAWAAASPSAAMSTKALLEARVSQLETGTEPRHPPTERRRVLPTLVAALLLGSAFIWSAIIVVHYMPQCIPGLR